jgi:hypothetical protein
LPQQQPLPWLPLECIGHLLAEGHILSFDIVPLCAIIGHRGPDALPDIIGHFSSLHLLLQQVGDPPCALL